MYPKAEQRPHGRESGNLRRNRSGFSDSRWRNENIRRGEVKIQSLERKACQMGYEEKVSNPGGPRDASDNAREFVGDRSGGEHEENHTWHAAVFRQSCELAHEVKRARE